MKSIHNLQILRTSIVAIIALSALMQLSMRTDAPNDQGGSLWTKETIKGKGYKYAIKPIEFEGPNELQILVEFEFLHKGKLSDSAYIYVDLVHHKRYTDVEKVKFTTLNEYLSREPVHYVSHMQKGKKHYSRFVAHCKIEDVKDIFKENEWTHTIYADGNFIICYPTAKANKKIDAIRDGLFSKI